MPLKSPCLEQIIAAAKGEISEKDAARILRDLAQKARARAAETGLPLDKAAQEIADELEAQEQMKAALSKRAALFNIRARQQFVDAATRRGKTYGEGVMDYMNEVYNAGLVLTNRWKMKIAADAEAAGLLREFRRGGPELARDWYTELWQLSIGQPFVTKNKAAQVFAKTTHEMAEQYMPLANKHGANVRAAAGWTGPQTHDPDILRRAGNPSGKAYGKESVSLSYEVWREHLATLNIDWERTLPAGTKEEQERFLKSFHESAYSGVHGETTELVDPSARIGSGSLAEKISSQRLLWFGDAASQFEYNQRWGKRDFNATLLKMADDFGRNVAMLEYLGPNAQNTFDIGVRRLLELARESDNAQTQVRSLERRNIRGAYDLISGKTRGSTRPWLSNIVDVVKRVTIGAKGGGIVFSMLGDRGFIDTDMALHAATALQRIHTQLGKLALRGEEGKELLNSMGFYSHSLLGHVDERFSHDVRGGKKTRTMLDWMFKLQGVNWLTDTHNKAAFDWNAQLFGRNASQPFEKLSEIERLTLEHYDVSPAEWEAIRGAAFKHGEDGQWTLLIPDRMQDLSDDVMATLLREEGVEKPTHPQMSRRRDLLESKLSAMYMDRVTEMVPTPGLREKLLMTGDAAQRGPIARELRELFFIFKGFGLTVAMRNVEKFKNLYAAKQYTAMGMQMALLIAETTALGYLGWAAREFVKGKTPPSPFKSNGEVDLATMSNIVLESMKRGGGLGIYGDYMLSEYDKAHRSFLSSVAGPALSELDPLMALGTSARKLVTPGAEVPERFGYDALRFAENNTPFLNLFYTKFLLDQFILWNLKEGLSPGVLRREERRMKDQRHQEYWIEPITDY